MTETVIAGRSFTPADLRVQARTPGISAFMRIRNGEDFLETTIRSHAPYLDEIIAVYNQCTDQTAAILHALRQEIGPKLKIVHYADRVHPPGSSDHARTDPASPNSLVNYYNIALSLTTHTIATKLDDDHLAIAQNLDRATRDIAWKGFRLRQMQCFSGLNLQYTPQGTLAIPVHDPVSGNGDIGFFEVTEETCFAHDPRFERFRRGAAPREFCGYLYWHLKYLKQDMGFANYELGSNPQSRYARKLAKLTRSDVKLADLADIAGRLKPQLAERMLGLFSEKQRLKNRRNDAIAEHFGTASVTTALKQSVPAHNLGFLAHRPRQVSSDGFAA